MIIIFSRIYSPEPHEVVRRSNPGNDQPEIDVVYLTPSNIDTMLDFIQPPNWKEIKHRRKPFTIFVEGIVGTGKTTFLQSFQVCKILFKSFIVSYLFGNFFNPFSFTI